MEYTVTQKVAKARNLFTCQVSKPPGREDALLLFYVRIDFSAVGAFVNSLNSLNALPQCIFFWWFYHTVIYEA